jgi:hypothetical protein
MDPMERRATNEKLVILGCIFFLLIAALQPYLKKTNKKLEIFGITLHFLVCIHAFLDGFGRKHGYRNKDRFWPGNEISWINTDKETT